MCSCWLHDMNVAVYVCCVVVISEPALNGVVALGVEIFVLGMIKEWECFVVGVDVVFDGELRCHMLMM